MTWQQTYSGPLRCFESTTSSVIDPGYISGHELEFTNEGGEVHVVELVRRSNGPGVDPRLRIISRRPSQPEMEDLELHLVWFMPAEILPAVLATITELMARPYA